MSSQMIKLGPHLYINALLVVEINWDNSFYANSSIRHLVIRTIDKRVYRLQHAPELGVDCDAIVRAIVARQDEAD